MRMEKLDLIRIQTASGERLVWRTAQELRHQRWQNWGAWASTTSLAGVALVARAWKWFKRPAATTRVVRVCEHHPQTRPSPQLRMRLDTRT